MDEWLLRWPDGPDGKVDVYRNHHWQFTFQNEAAATTYIRSQGGEPSNPSWKQEAEHGDV